MKYLLVGLLSSFSMVAYCQLMTDSILIENHYRSFSYYPPSGNIANGSLVFIMHGSGGNSNNMIKPAAKLESIAASEKLLVVYPNGYQHFWNECRKYSNAVANKEDINEQAFFTAMIDYFQKKYSVNKEKVFAAGFSGGGQMAYKLALTMPGTFKAVTAVVANMPDSASCDCVLASKPMPVMIINGTDDKTNPYNGGEMFVNNASFGVVLSSENSLGYWAKLAGYTGAPEKTLLPDADTADHKTIEKYSYHQKNKPTVTLLKVVGGHHDYPNDIDVYTYAWQFFKGIK
jgi:polyhydroxybutyrate depolymerase